MCLDFGGSNQIQLKSYEENRVTAWVKIYILSTQILQTKNWGHSILGGGIGHEALKKLLKSGIPGLEGFLEG